MSVQQPSRTSVRNTVQVTAPARLHMGFVNPTAGADRQFGSIGVALQAPGTRIMLRASATATASGPDAERALSWLYRAARIFGFPPRAHVEVQQVIPAHVGLGSGTQLALAVGVGLARLYGSTDSVRQIALVTERGTRSGIGVAAFEQGGFLVDGGRGSCNAVPPLIARLPFPESWRIILAFDAAMQGLHGQQELDAFDALPGFAEASVAHLARMVLTHILPAVAEQDLPRFGAAVTELQQRVGDHFAPAQGGRFASGAVADALAYLGNAGATALGQSSWGTGFCVVDGQDQAERLVAAAGQHLSRHAGLRFLVARARNVGATVTEGCAGAVERPGRAQI